MRLKYYFFSLFLFFVSGCSDDNKNETTPDAGQSGLSVEKPVTIDAGQTFQTIAGFGASDCWMPAYVGKYWTSGRSKISELLFSSEIQSGNPKGIGLSMWRVNLGGGTAGQGDASGIEDKSRRAESYLTDDLTFDWTRCEGQRYFLARAKELGCESIVLFSNTPPVQYTYNGKGFSGNGGISNLRNDCYDDFASYMAEVARHYVNEGYPVTHISPVNEPQYNWGDGGQEGSGWTNDEVAGLIRKLDEALTSFNLSVNILPGESGDWEYLYKTKNDANRSHVLPAFFTPDASAYIGDLNHIKKLICGHSYWTDGTWDGMRNVRNQVDQAARQYDVDVWQSEWSMLGDEYSSEFAGYDQATEMDIALYMSKVIHNDLTVAGVSSWCFWTAMDVSRWGHKNRFLLISLIPKDGVYGDIQEEGAYQATATLWVLGNYSRFIRPGYRRIALELNESRSFFGSAWISPDESEIVAVYTNLSDKGVRLKETHTRWNSEAKSITTYTTTGSKKLKENAVAADQLVVLDAGSVTTVIYRLN